MVESLKKIAFIVNPKSGNHGKTHIVNCINERIDKNKYKVEVVYTQYAGHAAEIAAQKAKENAYAVVAVGGDGTVNKLIPFIINTEKILGIIF